MNYLGVLLYTGYRMDFFMHGFSRVHCFRLRVSGFWGFVISAECLEIVALRV